MCSIRISSGRTPWSTRGVQRNSLCHALDSITQNCSPTHHWTASQMNQPRESMFFCKLFRYIIVIHSFQWFRLDICWKSDCKEQTLPIFDRRNITQTKLKLNRIEWIIFPLFRFSVPSYEFAVVEDKLLKIVQNHQESQIEVYSATFDGDTELQATFERQENLPDFAVCADGSKCVVGHFYKFGEPPRLSAWDTRDGTVS